MTIKKFFSVGIWVLVIAFAIISIFRISNDFEGYIADRSIASEVMSRVSWIFISLYFILDNYRDEK